MVNTVILGWAASLAALAAMVLGHLGSHGLSWQANQISTYAARAPNDIFVTAAMWLAALGLLTIGVLVPRYRLFGPAYWVHLGPLLAGAAAAGLVMLACYEETAASLALLEQSGFQAIRQQSFHDAGLQVFFYSGLLLVAALGLFSLLDAKALAERLLGIVILGLAPASFLLMTTPWAQVIGLAGTTTGLQQRAALLCLWLAMVCVLALASDRRRRLRARRIR